MKIICHTSPNKDEYNAQSLNSKEIMPRLNKDFKIFFVKQKLWEVDERLLRDNIFIIDISNKSKIIRMILCFYYYFIKNYDLSFYYNYMFEKYKSSKFINIFNKNRKIISITESIIPDGFVHDDLLRSVYNFTEYRIWITERIVNDFKKKRNKDMHKILTVWIDKKTFFDRWYERENIVLSVWTFWERKRPELFLEIAKKFPNYKFIWIWEWGLKQKCINKIKDENITNAEIKDNMSHQELSIEMNKSKLFFFPSLIEWFPKVTLEAMACWLPVIAMNNYWPEHIKHWENWYIVDNDNQIEDYIKTILNNESLRRKMALNSIEISKNYTWDIVWSNINNFIEKVVFWFWR